LLLLKAECRQLLGLSKPTAGPSVPSCRHCNGSGG
jgi:hypothetical protein